MYVHKCTQKYTNCVLVVINECIVYLFYNTSCHFLIRNVQKEDTSAVAARNLEVVQKLYHFLSAGVTGIRVSHLGKTHTHTHKVKGVIGL